MLGRSILAGLLLAALCGGEAPVQPDLSRAAVLVTGAAGFIGSHVTLELARLRCPRLHAADSFSADYSVSLKRERAHFVHNATGMRMQNIDVCDLSTARQLAPSKYTHIVHLVRHSGPQSDQAAAACLETLVAAASEQRRRAGQPPIVILHVVPSAHPPTLLPASNRTGVVISSIHIPMVYGRMDRPDQHITLLTEKLVSAIRTQPSPDAPVPYTHVDRVVEQLINIIAENRPQEVYNVPADAVVSSATMQAALVSHLNRTMRMNGTAAKQWSDGLIGYSPTNERVPGALDTGVRQFVEWYVRREVSLSPCLSECSIAGLCFDDGWAEPAAASRRLSEGCTVVLYTVATQTQTSELHPAHKDSDGCNIAFLRHDSVLFKSFSKSGGKDMKYRNWILVPIGDFGANYGDPRKPTRLPKLNPGKFFSLNVKFALYTDSSVLLREPPALVVQRMVAKQNDSSAAFAAVHHPRSNNVYDEFEAVLTVMNTRRSVTHYPAKVVEQRAAYINYQERHPQLLFNNIFDGSLLLHDLQSPGGQRFRCRWFREYQEWSDRDQLSGAFVLSMMNYEHSPTAGGDAAEWIALKAGEGGETVLAHVLPRSDHPYYKPMKPTPSKLRTGLSGKARKPFYSKIKYSFNP